MSEIEMTREQFADYFDQHTGTLKALLAQKDVEVKELKALLLRAADALESQLPQHEPSFVTQEMIEHIDLIAQLRKAAQ